MSSRVIAALVSCLLFGLCISMQGLQNKDDGTIILIGLAILTELMALPVGRLGYLSFSFVWLFALAQSSSATTASLVCLTGLLLRSLLVAKGELAERLDGFFSDFLPCQSSILVLELLTGEQGDFGFIKGPMSGFGGFLTYLLVSHLTLSLIFSEQVRGASPAQVLQARRLQFRLNTVLAPASAVLASQATWWSLWIFPVLLGVHHFSWDRLQQLRSLSHEDEKKEQLLKAKERQLEKKDRKLSFTEDEKEVIELCLREFSKASLLEPTRRTILMLAVKFSEAEETFLIEEQKGQLVPTFRVDASGTPLALENLPVRGLVERAQKQGTICRDKDGRFWAFPLFEEGVLLLSNPRDGLESDQKRLLALLARQATFGLRSARVFEQLAVALEGEKSARMAADKARQELLVSQDHLVQSSKMAAVGQLAAGVAHELNSPLAAVLLAVQAGKRALSRDQIDKGLKRFSDCEDAVRKAKHIVEGLLTQSKPTSKDSEVVSAVAVSQRTCQFLSERISRSGVKLEFQADEDGEIKVIEGEISQILTNLILNATQAVQRKTSGGKILVSLKRREKEIQIRVTDNGPGIADAHKGRVFEPFFTTKNEGTGLGLYICSQLAERNDARIELTKTGERGSTFVLTIPLVG